MKLIQNNFFEDFFEVKTNWDAKAVLNYKLSDIVDRFGFYVEEDVDGLDHYKLIALTLIEENGNSLRFAIRRHRGNPPDTISILLKDNFDVQTHIATEIPLILKALEIPESAIAWQSEDFQIPTQN